MVGFVQSNDNLSNRDSDEIKLLNDMMNQLIKETRKYGEFESHLKEELNSVKDMELNLKNIQLQFVHIKKLFTASGEIFKKLANERLKGVNMNITQCEAYLEAIRSIDIELTANFNTTNQELSKLYINNTHELYLESQNQNKIKSISDEAKNMSTEIHMISRYHSSLKETISQIQSEVNKIKFERKNRLPGY